MSNQVRPINVCLFNTLITVLWTIALYDTTQDASNNYYLPLLGEFGLSAAKVTLFFFGWLTFLGPAFMCYQTIKACLGTTIHTDETSPVKCLIAYTTIVVCLAGWLSLDLPPMIIDGYPPGGIIGFYLCFYSLDYIEVIGLKLLVSACMILAIHQLYHTSKIKPLFAETLANTQHMLWLSELMEQAQAYLSPQTPTSNSTSIDQNHHELLAKCSKALEPTNPEQHIYTDKDTSSQSAITASTSTLNQHQKKLTHWPTGAASSFNKRDHEAIQYKTSESINKSNTLRKEPLFPMMNDTPSAIIKESTSQQFSDTQKPSSSKQTQLGNKILLQGIHDNNLNASNHEKDPTNTYETPPPSMSSSIRADDHQLSSPSNNPKPTTNNTPSPQTSHQDHSHTLTTHTTALTAPQNNTEDTEANTIKLPPLELLHKNLTVESIQEDPSRIEMLREALKIKLADFSVNADVVNVELGPVISCYEVELAPGIKASKVTALAKDLARSLSVSSVRVVEVIPGKTCIGIEIPNHRRTTVPLKSVFESLSFQRAKSILSLALGVDTSGSAVIVDLCKMPHLLIAGTTGSGKSVGLNSLLLSLLFRTQPEDLRLILIDPKMLEFAVYEDIPHLLTPVVTDMNDASSALSWCVNEMERRYKRMAEIGVRNIAGYNQKIQNNPEQYTDHKKLPYIVVMADEFADMMMMVGKKVEQQIARLAQKARAAGIHLVLATQRPSVDVITGLIKANIPTRLSFQVSSKIDSRTIIDQQGAEMLLGAGDMLYLAPGNCVPMRAHGAYVTDEAIADVVTHLRQSGKPNYVESLLQEEVLGCDPKQESSQQGQLKIGEDSMYDEAVRWVTETQKVSISSVQRRLRVGYNRAANLVERMEQEGVVSAADQSGSRKVIAPPPTPIE